MILSKTILVAKLCKCGYGNEHCISGSEIGFIILSKTILVAKLCKCGYGN